MPDIKVPKDNFLRQLREQKSLLEFSVDFIFFELLKKETFFSNFGKIEQIYIGFWKHLERTI